MQRIPVESSNIAAVGYDAARYLLEVEFTNGSVYQYARVPAHLHEGLMGAASKGGFLARWIRDQYPTTKLDEARAADTTPTVPPSPSEAALPTAVPDSAAPTPVPSAPATPPPDDAPLPTPDAPDTTDVLRDVLRSRGDAARVR